MEIKGAVVPKGKCEGRCPIAYKHSIALFSERASCACLFSLQHFHHELEILPNSLTQARSVGRALRSRLSKISPRLPSKTRHGSLGARILEWCAASRRFLPWHRVVACDRPGALTPAAKWGGICRVNLRGKVRPWRPHQISSIADRQFIISSVILRSGET